MKLKIVKYKYLIYSILFCSSLFLSACQGCSREGLRKKAEENKQVPYNRDTNSENENTNGRVNNDVNIEIPQSTNITVNKNLKDLYKQRNKAVFIIYTSDGTRHFQGSGFFINDKGVGVSNYHVFEKTIENLARIKLVDGTKLKVVKVLKKSKKDDFIIFQTNTSKRVEYIPISENLPEIGEKVWTIGNPKGLEHTMSEGIVSGYRFENKKLIQTTTEITNGSSGGPLMNMNGEVVGITTSGIGEANLNFALNIQFLELKIISAFTQNLPKRNTKNTIKILTWNIQNLGRSKNEDEIEFIVNILKVVDVVAVQEVVAKSYKGAQTVAKVADELNRTGNKWDYSISNPTKSPSSYISERYAYFWKTSKIKLVSKPFLDTHLEDVCFREPYIAKFNVKKKNANFFIVNVHCRTYDQYPEREIMYFKNYQKRLVSDNIFILGDFNLNEKHMVWDDFYKMGFKSAIQNTPTTLKKKCKNNNYLNHSIDNIYFNTTKISLVNSGSIDFVGNCSTLSKARNISDHLPVYLECNID